MDLPLLTVFGDTTEAGPPFAIRLLNFVLAPDDDLIVIRKAVQGIEEIPFFSKQGGLNLAPLNRIILRVRV